MKKITALAAALVLCAAHASAYENSYAGYSVKDGQPYYKLEAKKVYAYTNISSKKAYKNEEDLKIPQLILLTITQQRIWSRF